MIESGPLTDSHGRVMRDLRISITDRCNFRCVYCLPETEAAANFYQDRFAPAGRSFSTLPIHRQWQPRQKLLRYEEIVRAVRIFAALGVEKLRITGGEPMLRRHIEWLIRELSGVPGIRDLAMTTNGFQFADRGAALREAGLTRISFSLDSLDRANFQKITGNDGLSSVLAAIREARDTGLQPVKVNAVVIRGLNDHEVDDLASFAFQENVHMRFIEFMPLDSGRAWLKELVMPGREILERLQRSFTLHPVAPRDPAETARRWSLAPGGPEIGIIAPVTEPFCGHCNRIRLTADGKIRTCLFSLQEHDLRRRLRDGTSDQAIAEWLREVVWTKEERHHIGEPGFRQPGRTMSSIGG